MEEFYRLKAHKYKMKYLNLKRIIESQNAGMRGLKNKIPSVTSVKNKAIRIANLGMTKITKSADSTINYVLGIDPELSDIYSKKDGIIKDIQKDKEKIINIHTMITNSNNNLIKDLKADLDYLDKKKIKIDEFLTELKTHETDLTSIMTKNTYIQDIENIFRILQDINTKKIYIKTRNGEELKRLTNKK